MKTVFGNRSALLIFYGAIVLSMVITSLACTKTGSSTLLKNSEPRAKWKNNSREALYFPLMEKALSRTRLKPLMDTPISAGNRELRVWVFASDQSVEGFILRQGGGSMSAKLVTDRFVQNKELEFNIRKASLENIWNVYFSELNDHIIGTNSNKRDGVDAHAMVIIVEIKDHLEYRYQFFFNLESACSSAGESKIQLFYNELTRAFALSHRSR